MGVITVYSFRTLPGGFARHVEVSEEARRRLQTLGLQAATMTPINGSFTGQIGTVILSDDNSSWAAELTRVQADESWTTWYASVASEGFAEEVESSMYVDLDPTFTASDRAVGAMSTTQWRPLPGRAGDLLTHIEGAKPHIARLGGEARVLQCINGAEPMTVSVSITFEDLQHLGEYSDKLAVDEQWSNYWMAVMADPSATLVRAGTFIITV